LENIFRSLSFTITQLVYPLISYLYNIFELIAKNQFFTNSDIEALSQNIYIIISACMLFTLGLKLLSAIVNPDALDGESGGKGTKRTAKSIFFSILIALFLIILIPIGFNWLYTIQSNDKETGILDRHLVEKIVLGTDTTEDHVPGQILASYAFASFCHPKETVSVESIANDGGNLYNLAITENIEYIRDMDGVINSKTDGEYDIEYHAILSPAVGLFLTYEMILICIDIALRSIKLGLLQLITSVVLCGYVVAGSDLLKRWAKEVMSTYLIVYIKIAAMSFMVYGLSLLEGFLDRLDFADDSAGFWSRGLIRVFVIIGLLQLVRQLPDLINKIFGTNIQRRGGIRGRLGEMAAVGDIAQRAWDQLRTHPLQTGQRLISAPLSAIGGGLTHLGAAAQKGIALRQQMQNNGASGLRSNLAMMRTMAGGLAGSFGAMFRAGHQGFQQGNLHGIGGAFKNYNDTHPTDMLEEHANRGLLQSINPANSDRIRTMLGAPTRLESQQERNKYVEHNGRRMTMEELQARQSINKAFDDARSSIRSQVETAFDRESNTMRLNDGSGGVRYELRDDQGNVLTSMVLRGNSASVREQIQALSNASAADLGLTSYVDSHGNTVTAAQQKADLIAGLNQQYANVRNSMLDAAENEVWNRGRNATTISYDVTDQDGVTHRVTNAHTDNNRYILDAGSDRAIVDNVLDHVTDLYNNNADLAADMVSTTSTVGNGFNQNGDQQIRVSNFRDGARNAVIEEYNSINRDVTEQQERITAEQNTIAGRERAQSHDVVRNHQNNNGGNNHGGNNG